MTAYEHIQETPDFKKFWEAYPKKMSKADAKKAWLQTEHIRPQIAEIIKAVLVAKKSEKWREDGGKFIPYPASWLRGERWEDSAHIDLGDVVNGKMWHETATGIIAKGAEHGLTPEQYSGDFPEFRAAVMAAASNVRQLRVA